jgi:hypothetical protein
VDGVSLAARRSGIAEYGRLMPTQEAITGDAGRKPEPAAVPAS